MTAYRQIAARLRWRRVGERRLTCSSVRPRDEATGAFTDGGQTVVEFGPEDVVDVPLLLAIGAIAPLEPPRRRRQEVE